MDPDNQETERRGLVSGYFKAPAFSHPWVPPALLGCMLVSPPDSYIETLTFKE